MNLQKKLGLAKVAWSLIEREKYANRDQDSFDEASEIFQEEARARFSPEDDGDPEAYFEEAQELFEVEWNHVDHDDDGIGAPESADVAC
jgi:hypothetical protein